MQLHFMAVRAAADRIHLEKKYDQTTAKECDANWGAFRSPMGGLAPEEQFTRQILRAS